MDRRSFLEYMNKLEQRVIVPAANLGIIGADVWAPIRNGKLHSSELAELLGTRFVCPAPMVIEYYGLHKRSTGFMEKAVRLQDLMTGFTVPFVNFSAVRDVHVRDFAKELLVDFPTFKEMIVVVRFVGQESDTPACQP